MSKSEKSKKAKSKTRAAQTGFSELVQRYASSHKVPDSDNQMFADMLGKGRLCDTILGSDLLARVKATKYLGAALERKRRSDPKLSFYLWTIIPADGQTSDRTPDIPLKAIQASTDRVLRKFGQDGMSVAETTGLGNFPRKKEGRSLLTATHCITWCVDPLDTDAIMEQYELLPEWHNPLGALPIDVKRITDSPGELDYLSYYLLKPPYEVKMLEDRKAGPRLKSTTKGLQPEFAVRLLEYLSQVELTHLIRATGEGAVVRQEMVRRLRAWHRSREAWQRGRLPSYQYDDFWDKYRNKKRKKACRPYVIRR